MSKIPGPAPGLPGLTPQEEREKGTVKSFWNLVEEKPVVEAKPYAFADLEQRAEEPTQVAQAPEPEPEITEAPEAPTYQEEARKEAEAFLQAARADAKLLREQAQEQGRQAGYQAGYEQATELAKKEQEEILHQRTAEALQQITDVVQQLDVEKQRLLDEYMDDLRDLTLTIAEKVINVSLKSSGDIIERMIVAATERSKNQAWAKVNLSKYDAEVMMQGDMSILSALQSISPNIKVVAMDNGQPGDCIIEFPDQIIDAGVKTQLDNIKEIMRAGDND